jgi:hypothetical protein
MIEWNDTTGYAKWKESSDTHDVSSDHTIENLTPGTKYAVKIDGVVSQTLTADQDGKITFTYSGGYSEKTFEVEKVVEATTDTTSTQSSGSNGPIFTGTVKNFPNYKEPRQQIVYPDGQIVYLASTTATPTTTMTVSTSTQTTQPKLSQYNFSRNLSLNTVGKDVKALQQFLNTHGFVIAKTGVGSPGKETTIFGILTYRSLQKFQKSVGLPATGFFGLLTRGYISKH